jgi:dTDP-4-amino-4,6-dideoxygalactose transaminase
MKRILFANLKAQNNLVRNQLISNFVEVLDSGNYVSGKHVENFELEFAKIHQSSYAVACNSGTVAIEIILKSLGIGEGDEVILPAMTFVATMEAVVATGATPVLVDVDKITWNISVECVKKAITKNTKAIIFVHLHGSPAGIEDIQNLCILENIYLVEDAAQAHLARSNNKSVGTFGIAAAFSFYPGKNLGALGEGGAIVTSSKLLSYEMSLVRNWGSKKKYVHEIRGSNFRMDEIQASFLAVKLKNLPEWTKIRRNLASIYDKHLDASNIIRPYNKAIHHSYHIYAIRINERDEVALELNKLGIETGIHYPNSLDKMKPWEKYFRVGSEIKYAHLLAKELISLPIHESLRIEDIEYVSSKLPDLIHN